MPLLEAGYKTGLNSIKRNYKIADQLLIENRFLIITGMGSRSRKTRLCHLFSHIWIILQRRAAIFNCSSAIIHVAAVLINAHQDTKAVLSKQLDP